MKRLLYLAILTMVSTLAFASVAMAQSSYAPPNSTVDCSAAEEGQPPGIEFFFLPDAGGCIAEGSEGNALGPLLNDLNKVVFSPETGERLGSAKELDPDLSSGANSVTYQEFCGAFSDIPEEAATAQEYFDRTANTKEQAILDPNGDGLACTAEDAAFLSGGGGAMTGGEDGMDEPTTPATPTTPTTPTGMSKLPDTGGPAFLLAASGLLVGSGLVGLFVAIRRRA